MNYIYGNYKTKVIRTVMKRGHSFVKNRGIYGFVPFHIPNSPLLTPFGARYYHTAVVLSMNSDVSIHNLLYLYQ